MNLVKSLVLPVLFSTTAICAIFFATAPTYGESAAAPAVAGPSGGPGPVGPGGPLGGGDLISQLTTDLTLTADQVTAVTSLLATEHRNDDAARDLFTEGFEAILTPAQVTIYEARGDPRGSGPGPIDASGPAVAREVAFLTKLLNLTSTQQTAATALRTTLDLALAADQSAFVTGVEAMLSADQLLIYKVESVGGGEPPFGRGVAFVANYATYLVRLLTLTAGQQTAVLPLLQQLQVALTAADSISGDTARNAADAAFDVALGDILSSTQLTKYNASLKW